MYIMEGNLFTLLLIHGVGGLGVLKLGVFVSAKKNASKLIETTTRILIRHAAGRRLRPES